jgi:hypothetical protein
MRILALLLVSLIAVACSVTLLTPDDLELYCHSRILKPLILPKAIAEAHPRMFKQFMRAIDRWELSAPVDFKIIDEMYGPRGSISVGFGTCVSIFDPTGMNILGFFNPEQHILFFNERMESDAANFSDDSIYKTCLHELGHVLGLPHIVGKLDDDGNETFEAGGAFDIVLPTKAEAKKCIMYPVSNDKDQEDLTEIEILWVRHALMHDLNLTTFLGACNYEKDEARLHKDQTVVGSVPHEGD